jgi:RNA polymerase sigma factor (sigma-70 family)
MESWQTGDRGAFAAFFHDYEKAVFRTAYLITGRREDAEDVLQDVFVAVWKSRHTYDAAKGKPSTWLHRITVNECLRKRRRDRPVMLRVDPEAFETPRPAHNADPGAVDSDELSAALQSLDVRHRSVLVLRYFNDLSYDEIARVLGVPLGTVKSRINHALKNMRSRLEDPGAPGGR